MTVNFREHWRYADDGRTLLGGVRVAGDALLALQTVPGETTVPHIDRLGLDGSYQNCLFVEFSVPDEDGNRHPVFYTFQLSDGAFTPFSLSMTFNQTILPVFSQTSRGLLVQKDWLPVSRGDSELYLPQWALISPENYLRSNPEWIATGQLDLAL